MARQLVAELLEHVLVEHAGAGRGHVGVVGVHVPAPEHEVVEVGERHVVADERAAAVRARADADGAHLGERADRRGQPLPDGQHAGDEGGPHRAHAGQQHAQLSGCGSDRGIRVQRHARDPSRWRRGAQAARRVRDPRPPRPLPFERWPEGTASCRDRSTWTARARPKTIYPSVEAVPGLVVTQRGTPFTGRVIEARGDRMTIRDERTGREHVCRLTPGGFVVDGRPVTLVPPVAKPVDRARRAHRVGLAGRARRQARGGPRQPHPRRGRARRRAGRAGVGRRPAGRGGGGRAARRRRQPARGRAVLRAPARPAARHPARPPRPRLEGAAPRGHPRPPGRARHRPPVRRRVAGDQAGGRRASSAGPTSRWASPGRRAWSPRSASRPPRPGSGSTSSVRSPAGPTSSPSSSAAVERLIDFVTEPAPD